MRDDGWTRHLLTVSPSIAGVAVASTHLLSVVPLTHPFYTFPAPLVVGQRVGIAFAILIAQFGPAPCPSKHISIEFA